MPWHDQVGTVFDTPSPLGAVGREVCCLHPINTSFQRTMDYRGEIVDPEVFSKRSALRMSRFWGPAPNPGLGEVDNRV
jgi:hypothetical protein